MSSKPEGWGLGRPPRVAVVTASDRCFSGERADESGPLALEIARAAGYERASYALLPDDRAALEAELRRLCDGGLCDLALTTGGTGFAPRDVTPEATAAVAERLAPGIGEAMRAAGLAVTRRAMLGRGIAAIRGRTLIVNLPGSPKAVRECLEAVIGDLAHGLELLAGGVADCGPIAPSALSDQGREAGLSCIGGAR